MIQSMTGYGKATAIFGEKKINKTPYSQIFTSTFYASSTTFIYFTPPIFHTLQQV